VHVKRPTSEDRRTIYETVSARRAQWDNLVWQVPLLSLTAQAFLFSIALSPDGHRFSRAIAAALSVVVSFLCITLMARHRQAELTDAHWLRDRELEMSKGDVDWVVHGEPWRERRDAVRPESGVFGRIPLLRGYRTWVVGLLLFLLAALVILVMAIFWPHQLDQFLGQGRPHR
jgi:hypothetical protein